MKFGGEPNLTCLISKMSHFLLKISKSELARFETWNYSEWNYERDATSRSPRRALGTLNARPRGPDGARATPHDSRTQPEATPEARRDA